MLPIWLITFVAKTGVAARFQKAVAWLFVVLAIGSVVGLAFLGFHNWLANQKSDAVQLDRADITQEVTNRVIAADREANANAAIAANLAAENEKELDREARSTDNATANVLRRMREQQNAGRR